MTVTMAIESLKFVLLIHVDSLCSNETLSIQRDYVLSEERTIKSIIEYKKALENITRQFEQACEIEEEK